MSEATATENRTSKLEALAGKIRHGIEVLFATQQEIGALLLEAQELYTAAEKSAFEKWSQTVTGWSKSNVQNVMDSVTVLQSLNAQQRGKVEKWSTASIVSLKPVASDKAQLRSVVSAVKGTRPDPATVRAIRDSVTEKPASGRTRQSEADKTRALAEKIRQHVERTAGGRDSESFKEACRLMMVGAQLVLDQNRNPLVPKAIAFVGVNPAPEA